MGYSIGYSGGRDIGYGVVATCDQPGCDEKIDRGMSYACGELRDDNACGLYFCINHTSFGENAQLCDRCLHNEELGEDAPASEYLPPYDKKPDHPDWIWWKLNHPSWKEWRNENSKATLAMHRRLRNMKYQPPAYIQDELKEEF